MCFTAPCPARLWTRVAANVALGCLLAVDRAPAAGRAVERASAHEASISVEEIRDAVARAHHQLRSLKVTYDSWNLAEMDSGRYLRVIAAARDVSRHISWRHDIRGRTFHDPDAFESFFDGLQFNKYVPFTRRYEISRQFAVPPYTDKIRSEPFFESLAWWPPGDCSEPLRFNGRDFFLVWVLQDPECRVTATEAFVDGWPCRIVEIPGLDRLWINVEHGLLLRRERLTGEEPARLLCRWELSDYREVDSGIRLPYRIQRTLPMNPLESLFEVVSYEVNAVPDSLFTHAPVPGTIVYDRDTDQWHQVPGGLDLLDATCRYVQEITEEPSAATRRSDLSPPWIGAMAACGAALYIGISRFFRVGRGLSGRFGEGPQAENRVDDRSVE